MARLNIGELLKKDFADGTTQGFTAGSVSGGKLSIDDWTTSVYQQKFIDVTYSFKLKITSVSGVDTWRSVRPVMRYKDGNNKYMLQISPNENKVFLYSVVGGSENYLTEAAITNELNVEYAYTWKTTSVGANTTHVITRDGTAIINYVDTGNTTLNTGYVGFHNNGATALIDDVLVTSATAATRTAATNRVAVQDIKSSYYQAGSGRIVATSIPNMGSGFSYAGIVKFSNLTQAGAVWGNSTGAGDSCGMTINSNYLRAGYYNGVNVGSESIPISYLSAAKWYKIVYTFDGTNGRLYVDGARLATGTFSPSLTATNALVFGAKTDNTLPLAGTLSTQLLYNRVLTASEIASFQSGTIPTSPTVKYELQEGAGTTAYDSSGNGNNGTITSGTYTSDVPTKKRGVVGGNLVYNGDFEYAPPFTAATTAAGRWIDGTSSGGADPIGRPFGWGIITATGSVSSSYDSTTKYSGSNSLKVSTLGTGALVLVRNAKGTASSDSKLGAMVIPVLPNTSYTFSYRMKTSRVSGSASTGAYAAVNERSGDFVNLSTTTAPAYVATTTDWTQYTSTFTTGANTRFACISLSIVGNDGAGTLIMDAWFDDIELRPTAFVPRGVAA